MTQFNSGYVYRATAILPDGSKQHFTDWCLDHSAVSRKVNMLIAEDISYCAGNPGMERCTFRIDTQSTDWFA
jgi:hypothetical protein